MWSVDIWGASETVAVLVQHRNYTKKERTLKSMRINMSKKQDVKYLSENYLRSKWLEYWNKIYRRSWKLNLFFCIRWDNILVWLNKNICYVKHHDYFINRYICFNAVFLLLSNWEARKWLFVRRIWLDKAITIKTKLYSCARRGGSHRMFSYNSVYLLYFTHFFSPNQIINLKIHLAIALT